MGDVVLFEIKVFSLHSTNTVLYWYVRAIDAKNKLYNRL